MPDRFSADERSAVMRAVRSKDTTPELIVRRIVHRLGYRFRLHVKSLPGTPDVVLARHRKIIEIRGCFWHMHHCGRCTIPLARHEWWKRKLMRNAERDRLSIRKLRRGGWRVLVVWECRTRDVEKLAAGLAKFLSA
ncbi:MAG TPA: DNA mismatch endonuclease Vsr [Tepidisphaeraceae bacterium]|jgi:DNA mismatch endonuclease (patch repair protein)